MFWIVMEDQPQTCTSRWHLTEEEAVREAIRLARKERHKFFVLKVVKSIEIEKAPVCIAVYDRTEPAASPTHFNGGDKAGFSNLL